MAEDKSELESLRKECKYYRTKTDELAGENLRLDYTVSGLRHELKQKKEGFKLLSALHESIGLQQEVMAIFRAASNSINSTLGMDKTIVLFPAERPDFFKPVLALGSGLDEAKVMALEFEIPEGIISGRETYIVNKAAGPNPLNDLIKEGFDLPYFIIYPVRTGDQVLGVFISGRMLEAKPLYPPLDAGDADTFSSIAGLISATVETMKVASLKENDRLKTEFFANISHEFRTPITLTIGPLEALLSGRYGEVNGRVKKEVEIVLRNQYRLLDLINQILDLAKMESGSMKPAPARILSLNEFVEQRLEQFNAMAEKRGLSLQRKYSEEVTKLAIYLDVEKFDKVIFNLLSNATKFTKKGGITVETKAVPGGVEIAVTDTGLGIRADQIEHIFDRFRQADGSQSREFAGTGIGLALAKQIVEVHGGEIAVVSEYGKGSTFKVKIPTGKSHFATDVVVEESPTSTASAHKGVSQGLDVREGRASEAEIQLVAQMNETALATRTHRAKILYADDNADLRSFVHGLLADEYALILAVDGQDGYEKAKRHKVDLVISDLMMPVMTGTEFLKKMKEDSLTESVPFIMLTAKGGLDTKIEELGRGVDDFLSKPFSASELQARVSNLLKIRQQQLRIKRDLSAARGIQQSLLPARDSQFGSIKVEIFYRPCEELSGDFFEIEKLGERIYFYVADVTSHGTASAQVTYLLRGIFKKIIAGSGAGLEVTEFVKMISEEYLALNLDYAVGLCFGCVDKKSGLLEYLTTNFPNPWLLSENKISAVPVELNDVIDPRFQGQDVAFTSNKIQLKDQDCFYCFTDGLFEIADKDSNRELGERGFSRLLQRFPGPNWRDEVFNELIKINQGEFFRDDMTILRIRRAINSP